MVQCKRHSLNRPLFPAFSGLETAKSLFTLQAYEHNLAAVEKHIENMAIRAVGSRASPAKGALDEVRRARISARSGGGIGLRSLPGGDYDPAAAGVDALGGRVPYGGSIRFNPA